MSMFHAGIDQRALLLGVVHDDWLAVTDEVVHNGGVFLDQHVGQLGLAKVFDQAASKVATTDDNHVISHFACEHAAPLLGVVALQRLKNKNRNDNTEQNALSPERIEVRKLSAAVTQIERAKERLRQR